MTTADLDRSLPALARTALRPGHVSATLRQLPPATVVATAGLLVAILGDVVLAGAVTGSALAFLASTSSTRATALRRLVLGLLGIVALGTGQALDYFGASTMRWTPMLGAGLLLLALLLLEGTLPRWRRATAGVLFAIALLPVVSVVPSVQVGTALVAVAFAVAGVLQKRS